MIELETYSKEFNSLTTALHAASLGQEPIYRNKYGLVLYDEIKNVPVTHSLELSDIEQQLRMFWFIFTKKWHESQPQITLRQYLLRRSIWALRDWYHWSMKPSGESHQKKPIEFKSMFPFVLDIDFLILGSDLHPFSLLTPYQRYILYLRYKEDLSDSKIAKIVVKTRKTMGLEFKRIIKWLRSQI